MARRAMVAAAFLAWFAALLLTAWPPTRAASLGAIRGRVEIPHPLEPPRPRPGVAALGADAAYRPSPPRRAVVYLETAPQGAFEEAPSARATMKQEHETFVPHVLAIRVGTIVDFPNGDPFFHNVFSLSRPKRFDLGRYPRGHSKAVQFDEPGIVRVFCEIHSHMSAFILVFAHRFFAVTDEDGRFKIDRVPPGSYTVTAWYESLAQATQSVAVPEQGGTAEANFVLRTQ